MDINDIQLIKQGRPLQVNQTFVPDITPTTNEDLLNNTERGKLRPPREISSSAGFKDIAVRFKDIIAKLKDIETSSNDGRSYKQPYPWLEFTPEVEALLSKLTQLERESDTIFLQVSYSDLSNFLSNILSGCEDIVTALTQIKQLEGKTLRVQNGMLMELELSETIEGKENQSQTTPPSEYLRCLADVQTKPVQWLWDNRIPFGKLTLIQGEPGVGKSHLALHIAAAMSANTNVIYQSAEDGEGDTLKQRFENAGGNCSRLFFIDNNSKPLTLKDKRIEETLRICRPSLMVIDPLSAYLGDDVDMNMASEVRPVLSHLAKLADSYSCAIILITHLSKSYRNRGIYASIGSIDIAASCRSVLQISYVKNYGGRSIPQGDAKIRVVTQEKNNLGPVSAELCFTITNNSRLEWKGEIHKKKAKPSPSMTVLERAKGWLLKELAKGPVNHQVVKDNAKKAGISLKTLLRARNKLDDDNKVRIIHRNPRTNNEWSLT